MHLTFALIDLRQWIQTWRKQDATLSQWRMEELPHNKMWLVMLVQHKIPAFTSTHIVIRELQRMEQDTSPHWTATLVQTASLFSKNLSSTNVAAVCYKGTRGCICSPASQMSIPELLSTKQFFSYKESRNEVQPSSWYQCTVCAQHADICRKCAQSDSFFLSIACLDFILWKSME